MKDGEIDRFAKILAVLGLKIVPTSMKCFNPRDVEHLIYCQQRYAEMIVSPQQLEWDGEAGL